MAKIGIFAAFIVIPFIPVHAIELDVSNADSIKSAATTIANGLVSYYHGNETGEIPGLLGQPYYWWEAGAMFDTLIHYWHLTGDSQYNSITTQGLIFQQGQQSDYMPANQSNTEGNDDQGIWALAAMSAAEYNLPVPEPQNIAWASLAQTVFNEQAVRWDTSTCGGGLRWQIYSFTTGYSYKNSLANGNFFQLAARLARYTGNTTYSDWASKSFDWSQDVGFINQEWNVFDGAQSTTNCTSIDKLQFSSTAGTYISGAAYMYNITTGDSQTKWKGVLDGLLNTTLNVFFPNGIATEVACEKEQSCTIDMQSYKGLLGRWLIDTTQVAPYTSQSIQPLVTSSVEAAAKVCGVRGNGTRTVCPFRWDGEENANSTDIGVGEQMNALSFVQGLLVGSSVAPLTEKTGGIGSGNATSTAGSQSSSTTSGGASSTPKNASVVLEAGGTKMMALIIIFSTLAWALL